jgi:uncharacterized protein YraI
MAWPLGPARAQGSWAVQFYNTTDLSGAVVGSTTVPFVGINWGVGSPWGGVNADNWSARFSSVAYFPVGTYRFYVQADDGINLFVDGVSVLNSFGQSKASILLSVDVALSEGNHSLQLDFQELGGDAFVYLSWANVATNPTGPNFSTGGSTGGGSSSGPCTAQYYNNPNLSGSPAVTATVAGFSNNWGNGSPAGGIGTDNFSARITCPQTLNGSYRVSLKADDGVRFYVGSTRYIDRFGTATGETFTADFSVGNGNYNLVVEFFEQTGAAFIEYNLTTLSSAPPAPVTGNWTVQFFNNTFGSPALTQNVLNPGGNWGTGSPGAGVNADNFLARWTNTQAYAAGSYRFTIKSDDGVRVYVNGSLVLDEWRAASGQTFTRDVSFGGGNQTIVVDYYEGNGAAFLEYNLTQLSSSGGAPPVTTGAFATINTSKLNVRNQPNRFTGAVVVQVSRGQSYAITGRNQDSSWWQLNVNGVTGWVNARYVIAQNTGSVPVVATSAADLPALTGYTITSNVRVNMRSAPTTAGTIVGVFPKSGIGQVVARSADGAWWKIIHNDLVGWVSAGFVIPQQVFDLNRIPVAAQ